ncbi:heterogeneous nuclear ribonucleoprotein C-like 1 isoform X3 [Pantherophis guttatus]|uniref:Heterogeneous nuclear ribonucleoprotein C-like 1 isoform X3 n=1 Tax=Pantherophis guttatus TaxID=94885 RepID=A0ABM3YNA4_PANGU|nr:heterogeneous nuclear ribonucleoprotein C-like 1 isoform X3 [Pantherophis guttatus]
MCDLLLYRGKIGLDQQTMGKLGPKQDINMAQEPKLRHTRPGQKRQHSESLYPSNCDLDYELYKDDLPYRIYECQKIPPLIGHIPIKTRRSHLGAESKSRLSPHTDLRSNSNPTTGRTKLRAEELHSIKGELSQIKVQVDNLLESLNRMDQQREHPTGELIRMKESAKNEDHAPQPEVDSAEESTDTEEATAVRNHTPDPEGSK